MKCKNGHLISSDYCPTCDVKSKKIHPVKYLSRFSKKRVLDNKLYTVKKIAFLQIHNICQVTNCNNISTQIHHRKGRIGQLLTDEKYFLATCDHCHKRIEMRPVWAKRHGYSVSRL